MSRMIKDYVEVSGFGSLDNLIQQLVEIRDSLPGGGEAEVRLRGDDVFGRHLCVGYLRPLTAEEAAAESRYSGDGEGLRAAA